MKQPEIGNPHGIFNAAARYKAPVYQRLYVWGRKQLDDLRDDIEECKVGAEQFLGAIVLKDLGKQMGPTSPTSYLIIDGQQRLTTLYLILAAMADIAQENGHKDIAEYLVSNYLAETVLVQRELEVCLRGVSVVKGSGETLFTL